MPTPSASVSSAHAHRRDVLANHAVIRAPLSMSTSPDILPVSLDGQRSIVKNMMPFWRTLPDRLQDVFLDGIKIIAAGPEQIRLIVRCAALERLGRRRRFTRLPWTFDADQLEERLLFDSGGRLVMSSHRCAQTSTARCRSLRDLPLQWRSDRPTAAPAVTCGTSLSSPPGRLECRRLGRNQDLHVEQVQAAGRVDQSVPVGPDGRRAPRAGLPSPAG